MRESAGDKGKRLPWAFWRVTGHVTHHFFPVEAWQKQPWRIARLQTVQRIDLVSEGRTEARGGGGLAHEPVGAMKAGQYLLDVVHRDHAERGYTWLVQRGSGHVAASGVPGQCRAGEQ